MMPAMPPDPAPVLQRVTADRIIDLRHTVLRAGYPRASAHFDGDDLDTTLHVAAILGGTVVGCATYMRQNHGEEPAYRLRGMATDPAWRGTGLGAKLLNLTDILMQSDPIRLRWCNARVPAIGFYLKQGWQVVSDEFDIPTAGPHHRMIRRLPA
jgi:predicted GNAT family N-acyltransferase